MGAARRAYQNVNAQTASPAQILLRLYEGAIRFTRQAQQAIKDKKPAEKGVLICKTMAIIDELITALDHQQAPELCHQLERLYVYMLDQLSQANIKMDPEPLDQVLHHLTVLHEAWEQAARETGG
jgi:flagellar protein FliS